MSPSTASLDCFAEACATRGVRQWSEANVEYRYATTADFDALDWPPEAGWLSPRERHELAAWRNPRRRAAWLRGRWLAKQCLAAVLDDRPPLAAIEVLSLDAAGKNTRPRPWCDGAKLAGSLSTSHTERGVLVAWSAERSVSLGVDLTVPAAVAGSVVRRWFTAEERDWAAREGLETAAFIWAAKEAIYKAGNRGESFAPRQVRVHSPRDGSYRGLPLRNLQLRGFQLDGHVAVTAAVDFESTNHPFE